MNENKSNICPCCPKGCELSAPRCSRGEEYLRTGIIPEKETRSHHHEDRRHPNYEEMSIDEKLTSLLSRLGRAGHGSSDGKSSQNRVLHILSKTERMTQRELTAQLGIQPGSASEIIKKLESAGLITRQSNSEDRRTVDIALTEAGKAQAEASSTQNTGHTLFGSLTEEEKQQLLALLEKLGQDWHNRFHGEYRRERRQHEKRGRKGGHDDQGGHDAEPGHGDSRKHGAESDHKEKHTHGHKGNRAHDDDHSRERKQRRGHHEGE